MTKRFGQSIVTAVDPRSGWRSREGEFFALLGPSGCGKTTLLRMLAGFEIPNAGTVRIDGEDMADVPPNRRPVNMVFQSYAVFPHMTVAENVGYGLKVSGTPRQDIGPRVREALDLVRLEEFGARRPDQLSGGQRQRVALARALVKRPKVLLLDEPLSALDAKLREAMQVELVRLRQTVGITFVIVTHDQTEALSMADRVAVMNHGRVQQVAPPDRLYEYPSNRFVADFIGRMNLFEGEAVGSDGENLILELPGVGRIEIRHDLDDLGPVGVAVRPEKVRLRPDKPADGSIAIEASVSHFAYYGSESHIFVRTEDDHEIAITVANESRNAGPTASPGDRIWVTWAPDDTLVFRD